MPGVQESIAVSEKVNGGPYSLAESQWDATLYDSKHSWVWRYGTELVEQLSPREGERILDLGCGTGHLTHRIALSGAQVIGLDRSLPMLEQARKNYPHLPLVVGDAACFAFAQSFDAVFTNAALHWIPNASQVVECVVRSLRQGGRFVAEFGAKGNLQTFRSALSRGLVTLGHRRGRHWNSLYFPSVAAYSALLEAHGLTVCLATLFDRPTVLEEGERGVRNWLEMFAHGVLSPLAPYEREALIQFVERRLRPHQFRDGHWFADYALLRIVATRPFP